MGELLEPFPRGDTGSKVGLDEMISGEDRIGNENWVNLTCRGSGSLPVALYETIMQETGS